MLVLAIVATAGAALVYRPLRSRLLAFGERHLGRARRPPAAVLRSLGGGLSRAVPLEELLLQTAELLRRDLGLAAAEVWTEAGGRLVRAASDPDRPRVVLPLGPAAQMVAARARVRGPAWLGVWLPELLAGRDGAAVQLAPIMHSGELLGAIVAERPAAGPIEDDELLGDAARQLGPVLRNAHLDSELHDSMQRLRRQAAQLRASRARIVTAADAERRRIERNLHDGAQQPLVALSLNLRLARELLARDPGGRRAEAGRARGHGRGRAAAAA